MLILMMECHDMCVESKGAPPTHVAIGFVVFRLNYTKYGIHCHMVLNVTMLTFWMTPLMNEFHK
jgi:hypothetical protein